MKVHEIASGNSLIFGPKDIMKVQDLVYPVVKYNTWANFQMVNWLSLVDEKLLNMEIPSSYPNIKLTFLHIWNAQRYWLSFLEGSAALPFRKDYAGSFSSFFNEFNSEAIGFENYLCSLSEEKLLDKMRIETPWLNGEMPCYIFIQHVLNHSTYHRGQLVTMGRVCGLNNPPNTDFSIYMATHSNP